LLYIYQSMLIISCFFMLYMMWSQRLKHPVVVGVLWNVSLIYMLSFCSTFFLMLGSFGTVQAIIFTLNLMVLFNLSRWKTALFSIIVGFVCGSELFKYYVGTNDIDIKLDQSYLIIYIALLLASALIAFLKPKQDYIEHAEAKLCALESEVFTLGYANLDLGGRVSSLKEKVGHYAEKIDEQQVEIDRLGSVAQKILNNVNHELRLPVGNVKNFSEMLLEQLEKYNDKEIKELTDEVYKNSIRLSSMILNMLDLATIEVKHVNLDKTLVNLSEIVKSRAQVCHRMYVEDKPIDIKLTIQPEIMLSVDPNYMKQVIDNLIINAIKFSDKGAIKIKLEKPSGVVTFTITDEGKGIPQSEIYDIFGAFKMASNMESKAEGRGVGLALCKSVIEAHGGVITAKSQKIGAKFIFVLPADEAE
ncbi:HAMP domain-containing histidine kinase, partial [Rickettsiaceae bacterium]|nr:HAMP domain-containing histidine kinase [Rickettsiaceae bacterium]